MKVMGCTSIALNKGHAMVGHRLHARAPRLDLRPCGVQAPAGRGQVPALYEHALRNHCRPGHLERAAGRHLPDL